MNKLTAKAALGKVQDFIDRMTAAHDSGQQGEFRVKERKMNDLMNEIEEFDRSLGRGLKVGRLVSWPQGDGQAFYFVTGIGRRVVRLAHLPWWDNWHSPVVVDGQALRPAVERAIKGRDGLRRIFGAPGIRPAAPAK